MELLDLGKYIFSIKFAWLPICNEIYRNAGSYLPDCCSYQLPIHHLLRGCCHHELVNATPYADSWLLLRYPRRNDPLDS